MSYNYTLDKYRDGGTVVWGQNRNEWCIDHRIGTKTPGRLTQRHPSDIYALNMTPELLAKAKRDYEYIKEQIDYQVRLLEEIKECLDALSNKSEIC